LQWRIIKIFISVGQAVVASVAAAAFVAACFAIVAFDFAFPFGDYNKQTSNILRSENFTKAVTTVNGLVKKDTDPLQFGRYLVRNVSGNLLIQEINKQLAEY